MMFLFRAGLAVCFVVGFAVSAADPRDVVVDRTTAGDVPLATLVALFGKTPQSPEYFAMRKHLIGEPEVYESETHLYHTWKRHGDSILFFNGKMSTVFLFADAADGHTQFRGELPQKIRLSDTRADVERKLGPPKELNGGAVIPVNGIHWVQYPEFGIGITYKSTDVTDMTNAIHHVSIRVPIKE